MNEQEKKVHIAWLNRRLTFMIYPDIRVMQHAIDRFRERVLREDVSVNSSDSSFVSSISDDEIALKIKTLLWSIKLRELKQSIYNGRTWYVFKKYDDGRVLKFYIKVPAHQEINYVESVVDYTNVITNNLSIDEVDPYLTVSGDIVATDVAISYYQETVEPVSYDLAKYEIEHAVERYKTIKTNVQARFKLTGTKSSNGAFTYSGKVLNTNRVAFTVWLIKDINIDKILVILSKGKGYKDYEL